MDFNTQLCTTTIEIGILETYRNMIGRFRDMIFYFNWMWKAIETTGK
jgi:hypothetical protein